MVTRKCAEGPDDEERDEHQTDSAGGPMREFDDGIQAGRTRQHLAITERPVLAATGARAGGTYEGAPQDDGNVEGQDAPRVAGEPAGSNWSVQISLYSPLTGTVSDATFAPGCFFCSIRAMRKDGHRNLSRRERQMMDILYQRGRATAAEIHQALPDAPSYSAVRAKLRVLEEKGHVRHEEEALRYVYLPTMARDMARKSALRHMVSTFFAGSVEETVAALLDMSAANLAPADLERISQMIETARKQGEEQ
jgi:BlaI family penicillinase repressor